MQAETCKSALQTALEQTDLSDAELAYRVGVNAMTIWRWRTGRNAPNSGAIRRALADVLGWRLDELFPR